MLWIILLTILFLLFFFISKMKNELKIKNEKLEEVQDIKDNLFIHIDTLLFRVIPFLNNEGISIKDRHYFEGSIRELQSIIVEIISKRFSFQSLRMDKNYRNKFESILKKTELASDKVNINNLNNYYENLGNAYKIFFIDGLIDIQNGYIYYAEHQFIEGLHKILEWKKWLKENYYSLNQLATQNNLIEYKNVDFGFSINFPKSWVQTINQSSCLLATPLFNENSHEIIDNSISVTIHKNDKKFSNSQSLEIYTKGMIEYAENIIEVKDTIFNSLKAKKITFTHNEFRRSYLNITYIFINDEGVWSVTSKILQNETDIHMNKFNEIINTFKFINPAY